MSDALSYSHYCEIIWLDIKEIKYYVEISLKNNLTVWQLRTKVKNNEYIRLSEETREKIKIESKLEVDDLIPNPILIKNKNNIDIVNKKVLHNLILDDIESFMHELGNGYCFIGSEYKIKIGDSYHKIDLLLFNIEYNAYVVVELKVTEFKVEYIFQVQKYMNYIDKNVKEIFNNDTIGILICKKENRYVIDYCSDKRIFSREYELV